MGNENENPFASPISTSVPPLIHESLPFPRRAILGSVLVMLPWPLFGIAACLGLSLFEKSSEAIFMFGSVTMIFLIPLALVVNSELILGLVVGVVWLTVLLMPLCFERKRFHPKFHIEIVLVSQSLFAAIQAGLGFLVVLGKYC